MKILVTGGAGFIGSHIVDYLINQGHDVIVVDNLIEGKIENIQSKLNEGNCMFIKEDIRNRDWMLKKLPSVEMIYHLAADPDVRNSVKNPLISYDHNMNGTINILEYTRRNKIKKLVFTSSGGTIYGESEVFPLKENFNLKPISPYGASKAAAEMYMSAYANTYDIKITSVRYANIFGERSRHGVGFDFFSHLMEKPDEITILGDGTQQKSYLYISDAVDATLLVGEHLDQQEKMYDYYNVGSEEWYTVNEIAAIYEKELKLTKVKHKYTGGSKGWVGDVAKMILSIEKLKNLGYNAKISFKEGIHRYCRWLKSQYLR